MLQGVKTGVHIWLRSVTLSGKAVVIRSLKKASLSFSFLPLLSFPYYSLLTALFLLNPLAFWYYFPLNSLLLSFLVSSALLLWLSCYLPFRVAIFPWWFYHQLLFSETLLWAKNSSSNVLCNKECKIKVLYLFIEVDRKDRHEINKILKLLENDNVGIRKCWTGYLGWDLFVDRKSGGAEK